ncbi:L-seryl-tRNA(Sec) kinase isoform X2 [Psammomys obesus]|uniref:L-seryl-tRNA(Sec) kinase isoform X2 n=1 Tax=Psammomys obesus TaxID=48139 RepID=UPI00245320E1|nr:L-seryl-tRNA(Sec) kinase isoform X2 [Psammomys obesus]
MKTVARSGATRSDGWPKLGLCVLCGLPAAGKSTFARALALQLRRERGWAIGVLSYDDVLPQALPDGAGTQPRPSRWKMFRQELLKHLECFLMAVISETQMSAPPNRTEAVWEDFITCLKKQDLIFSTSPEAQHCHLLAKPISKPLFLVLDDNFYYQSMRYEVYQLARKYCSLETCLKRNGERPQPLPKEVIYLMERKIERPNPEKNAWEHNSLIIQSSACLLEASPEVTDLLLTALENPIKCVEDNTEQKEADRIICSTNILHKADEILRRTVSQTMKEAKDEQMPLNNLKHLAGELNKLKADFLEDLRQGNRKYLCIQRSPDLSDVLSSFCKERDTIVQKFFSKHH